MKILVLSRSFPPIIGGISFSEKEFYDNFVMNNHKLSLFIFPYNFKRRYSFNKPSIDPLSIKKFFPRNSLAILINLVSFIKEICTLKCSLRFKVKILFYFLNRLILLLNLINFYEIVKYYDRKYDYDLILCFDSYMPVYIGYFIKKKCKKKLVILAHGNDILDDRLYPLQKRALRGADQIITRTNFIKNLVSNRFTISKSKISVCGDGLKPEEFEIGESKSELRKELGIDQNDFVIITVGALNSFRKGFDLVLKSLKELREKYNLNLSKIKYILIGHKNEKVENWLKSIAYKNDLIDNFKILVDLSDQLRNKYYKASDIFVMPSRDMINKGSIEGFGKVFIEAAYFRLPSIGANTGGIPEVIVDGKSGFVIDKHEELAEKILLLYKDKQLRLMLSEFAHKNVLENYTQEKVYETYLKIFNRIINK